MKSINYNFLLLLIGVLIFSCSIKKTEDTISILPADFEGPILIIFNQKDGIPKEYEDENRIYRIPNNGVLKTQFEPNSGAQKNEYYFVHKSGKRAKIPFHIDKNTITQDDLKYAYLNQIIGKVERYDPESKKLLYIIPPARSFYIGNVNDIEVDYQKQLNFIFENHK